jgi:integrase
MQPLQLPRVLQLPKSVKPLNGLPFNPSDETWSFNDGVTNYSINIKKISELTPTLVENIRLVLIWYVENTSGGQLESHYWQLVKLLTFIRGSHKYPVTSITSADLINYRDSLGLDKEWHLGSLASFLKKWHKFQLPGVAKDAVRFLNQVKIKGIEKGKAVRTMDPDIGPFSDIEVEAIRAAINDSYVNGNISKRDFLLTWLFLLLGQRVRQYALLKVKDIYRAQRADGSFDYILNIPRIKQQTQNLRDEFKERMLTPSYGEALFDYARELEKSFEGLIDNAEDAPLFPARSIRKNQPEAFHYHEAPDTLTQRVKAVIGSIRVYSERTGKLLKISSRRFRYTIGTRASKEGHGELIIAELLDHSDTQNVQVYTEFTPEIVERINKAVAIKMAPLAKAFAGEIISEESKAVRRGDITSRILDPRIDHQMRPMGNCARTGACGFIAPIACYTCGSFQAWLDGPHEQVLDYLLAERERLLRVADERIASINDRTILAVTDVVMQCKQMRESNHA